MIACRATVKKWGSSLGIVIPKDKADSEQIKESEEISIIISKERNKLRVRDIYGKMKGRWTETTEEMLKEIDKQLDSKFFR
ncbi:hypothetical protein HYV82_01815 [Candidatus Woesearchaeota archaeon]|nr:hypothetical protein [Candidatus Woesearchaeota archaeon]